MASYTYNEKKKFVVSTERLLEKSGNLTEALKSVSERTGVSTANLRNYWHEKLKIMKACANGWGKEVKLSDEKIKKKNPAAFRRSNPSQSLVRYSSPEPTEMHFIQTEVHNVVKVVRKGGFMESCHSAREISYTKKGGKKRPNSSWDGIEFANSQASSSKKIKSAHLYSSDDSSYSE